MTSEFGHSLRRLWRSPGFSCVVVVTLALGIGVNIALLTVLLALLGTGGVALPADLVAVTRIEPARGDDWNSVRKPELDAIASGTRAMFSQVIVHDWVTATLRSPTVSLSARGQLVSGNYFQTFGVVPTIGRLLHVADDLPFSHSTPLVVSEHFWRRHLQADPQVVGRQLTVNRHPVVVVGVAPNSFRGTWMPSILRTDFWMPVAASEAIMPREARHPSHRVLAVLRKGVSLTEADASVAAIGAGLVPWEGPALRLSVVPARAGIIPPQFDRLVHTVGATAIALGAIVLVIACANVSGLVAARTARRDSEVAIRTALGAGRSHLRRILAGEVAILGTVACLVAILLAHAVAVATVDRISGIASIVAFEPELALTGPVALLTLVVAVLACVVAGAPAVRRSLAIAPWACLGQGDGATSTVPAARRFVCLQVGITTVLLVPAGLLWGNARDALTRDPGFDLLHGATALVGPINEGMSAGQPFDVVGAILDDVRRIPDVVSVAATSSLPAISPPPLSLVSSVPHREAASDVRARVFVVTEGFFDALGIQLRAGRDFTSVDRLHARRVAVVSAEASRVLWPAAAALGQAVFVAGEDQPRTVVGVVADTVRTAGGRTPEASVYLPAAQGGASVRVVWRTRGDSEMSLPRVEERLRQAYPSAPVGEVMTLRGAAAFATLPVQMASRVMTGLAGIALVVAIVGVYGAIAALISERMREFALRRVLGASTGSIHLLLLRHGMAIAAKGGVPALVACALGLGALDGRFEDLRRHELAAFSAVAGLMILVTAVACYVPARRILSSDLAGLMRRP